MQFWWWEKVINYCLIPDLLPSANSMLVFLLIYFMDTYFKKMFLPFLFILGTLYFPILFILLYCLSCSDSFLQGNFMVLCSTLDFFLSLLFSVSPIGYWSSSSTSNSATFLDYYASIVPMHFLCWKIPFGLSLLGLLPINIFNIWTSWDHYHKNKSKSVIRVPRRKNIFISLLHKVGKLLCWLSIHLVSFWMYVLIKIS